MQIAYTPEQERLRRELRAYFSAQLRRIGAALAGPGPEPGRRVGNPGGYPPQMTR